MITIADILEPVHMILDLKSATVTDAVLEVCELLKDDHRVTNWVKFYGSLKSASPCVSEDQEVSICIPHARTDCVQAMVMAAGRSIAGIYDPETKTRVHWVFVIGVPAPLASDYLRIIGALARILRSSSAERALREARTKADIIELLVEQELAGS